MIPYGRQNISDEDIDAVVEVLRSDFLTQGPVVPRFEQAVAAYCGAGHGVAVNSGTSALHLACLALDIGPGDRVWTSPITYVATANCVRCCGADVDFVDIEPGTRNMSVDDLKLRLERARLKGELPKAVIPVHFAGQSCDMEELSVLAEEYGFRIIEDAAHALGATYRDMAVGSCRYSDITVFSFHPVKLMTTGEGGMAVTNQSGLAERMRRLRSHGINSDGKREGPWGYEQIETGFNYRMTDIQAALGESQLRRLDEFLQRRRVLAGRYDEKLAGLPLTTPVTKADRSSAWHLYTVELDPDRCLRTRREVFDAMRAAGIGVHVHYIPVYRQPYYHDLYGGRIHCEEAERYYAGALTLPLHPGLGDEYQDYIIDSLAGLLV
ncbi:MAG: UDP-4-amino-4,6-dideoxy-N-acetyl-beta-L-altrosamine transaminase [Gammaproteobacteria bacterium]